jgi:CBS domain-containing protein
MQTIYVAEVCEQSEMQALVVDQEMPLMDAVKEFAINHDLRGIFIMGEEGRLVGVINKQDLLRWVGLQLNQRPTGEQLSVGQMRRLVNAQRVADLAAPGSDNAALNLNDTLADALKKMASFNLSDIPVVDDTGRIINDLRLSEILLYMFNNAD